MCDDVPLQTGSQQGAILVVLLLLLLSLAIANFGSHVQPLRHMVLDDLKSLSKTDAIMHG